MLNALAGLEAGRGLVTHGALDFEGTPVPLVLAAGRRDGPALLLVGLQHAGELSGPATIDRLLVSLDLQKLRGTLVCLPVANPLDARTVPPPHLKGPDTNLNRQWPGDPASPNRLSRLAALLWKEVVTKVDALIDLHCCRIVDPRFGAALLGHAPSERLAESLALEAVDLQTPGSYAAGLLFMEAAARLGKPAAMLESHPCFFQPREAVEACAGAVLRAMRKLGMIAALPRPAGAGRRRTCVFKRTDRGTELVTKTGGCLGVRKWPCERVGAGGVIAVVRSLETFAVLEELASPLDGAVDCVGDPGLSGLVEPGVAAAGVKRAYRSASGTRIP